MLYLEVLEKRLPEGWPIMIGLDGNCCVCKVLIGRPCSEFKDVILADKAWDGYETPGRCSTCGSKKKLKHAAHTAGEEGDFVHLDICSDCMNYFINHETPKDWKP